MKESFNTTFSYRLKLMHTALMIIEGGMLLLGLSFLLAQINNGEGEIYVDFLF